MGSEPKNVITQERAVELANQEVVRLGYDITQMKVTVAKYETPWNNCISKDSSDPYMVDKRKKLTGRDYYAVSYMPKQLQAGGDACIFIDAENGRVITNYRGR